MVIRPIITVIFKDGRKVKYESYDRPPMLYLNAELEGGGSRSLPFERTGPDEYRELVKKTS
jgi:hypothetical protein